MSDRDREPRWTTLLGLLSERGRLTVAEAGAELGVSEATIRRDFAELAEQQLATRTHGAIVAGSVTYSLPARYRRTTSEASLVALATHAAGLIPAGSVVGLNGGRTTTEVARALSATAPTGHGDPALGPWLDVITNALNIASELALRPAIRCLVLGGVARPGSYEMTGQLPVTALRRLWLDTLVLGVDGLTADDGAMCRHDEEAAVNAAMVARAARVVVVADGSKIGRRRMARITAIEGVTTLVTDQSADPDEISAVRDRGVDVIQV